MTVRLADLEPCFEGVIPSIIATAAADGMPNISYLSHVVRVDDDHVALSNQFFAKTAANIRANPQVTLILVDCLTGDQYLLDIAYVRSVDTGALFDKIALQLKASSAQVGMSDVMRLRSADIFHVRAIEAVPSPVEALPAPPKRGPIALPALAAAGRAIEREVEAEGIIDGLLHCVRDLLGYPNALVLIADPQGGRLVTTGSLGYERSGLGSEVAPDEGLIGAAARSGRPIKVNDMSRVRRFGEAIATDAEGTENSTRVVAFPQLPDAMSQIAVPMLVRDDAIGVLFVESPDRMAFRDEDEAALEILAGQAARTLKAGERLATTEDPGHDPSIRGRATKGGDIRIAHHRLDDSIFVNDTYVVKGIAGALLRQMLEWHLADGRSQFSNRELRLALAPRMPDIKDNLETRLLLLRRRLDEKQAPLRIVRIGRGLLRLEAAGTPIFVDAPE